MKSYVMTERTDVMKKYFKDINKSVLLSIEEEEELTKRVLEGDEDAKNELIKANLKFVISVAKGYQGLGLDLSDLISEGNLGLIKAVSRFDPTKGFRFISYAVWWIKQSIIESLNENSRTIRLPVNIINKIQQFNKENPNFEEEENENVYPTCISLNTHINEFGNYELSETIEDGDYNKLDVLEYEMVKLKKMINNSLNCLTNKERGIIECYFGLNSQCEPMTLEAIGDRYDLTKERIRQIKEKAIRRLRHNNLELHKLLK